MRASIVALSLLASLAAACADDFDPPSRVIDLRLLAVQADQPFALPGSDVNLRALALDPEGRALSFGWGTCIDAESSLALDCLRATSFESLVIGAEREHVLRMPETDAAFVGVVVVACPGRIVRGDTEGIPLACVDAGGEALPLSQFEVGVKRVYVRQPAQNQNPVIGEVLWDGVPWPEGEIKNETCTAIKGDTCAKWLEHAVEVRAPGAVEQSVDREGLPITEQVVAQYYATAGEFEADARVIERAATTWIAKPADRGRVLLWFVVRDDRGGVAWTTRELALSR
ncbi:MAG: hypothetical protein ABW252_20050 [Polyangiales bacterium]